MYRKLKIVKVDVNYCDYLRNFDSRVSYNAGSKELRPFVGVLFMIDKCQYFAPLSSPKPKHKTLRNTLDVFKINDGNYGIVNFNNMIPVNESNYVEFDLNKETNDKNEKARINLMKNQLRFLTKNRKEIYTKSELLYNLYKNDKLPKNVKSRCCNFMLLEEKCREYNTVKE